MPTFAHLAALLVFAAAVPAQSYAVSPPYCANAEGGTWSDTPFAFVARYQQITGDLRGSARNLQGLSFRRDALLATNTGFTSKTLDLEILCSNSSFAASSATFASNYVGAPSVVFARRSYVTPDLTQQPNGVPGPWVMSILFDTPFPYAGTGDLLYELKVYSLTSGNGYPLDAVSARDSSATGAASTVGLGCVTQNGNMSLRGTLLTNTATNTVSLDWSVRRGPSMTTAGLLVGFANPNVPLPFVCPNSGGNFLYTDGILFSTIGSLDAFGDWNTPTLNVPFQAAYVGGILTAQAAAVDLPQGGIGVAVSNGASSTVAAGPSPFQIARVLVTGAGAATAATGSVQVGLGFVTRYQH
jgi:hypothetical protein